MQRQGIIFIIILIVNVISIMQINFKFRVGYNFFLNKGKIKLKIFRFVFIDSEFSFQKGYIKVINKKKKVKIIPLNINDPETFEFVGLETLLIKKIYLKRVNFYSNFGSKESSYLTSMAIGTFLAFSSSLGALIKTKKEGVIINIKSYPEFNKDYLKINLKLSASLSLFDFFWCFGEYQFRKKEGSL